MEFIPIDKETWPRREYFDHYFSAVPCFYSMTTALDITRLRQEKVRLYPALLYLLTQTVNRHIPFRTAIHNGQLGYFDRMEPSYTVFSQETETFSSIWTLCQGITPPSWPIMSGMWRPMPLRGSSAPSPIPRKTCSMCP